MDILIVETSPQIIERLAEILSEKTGIRSIHRSVSYEGAALIYNRVAPDIVLLDIGLPENKSVELLKEIKKTNPRTTVIVLSIHVDVFTKQKFNSAGADFFFDKYHDFEKLAGIINDLGPTGK